MSYATLMVHVDVDAELGCRVGIAAGLAERFHAHLIGVAGWAPMSVFLAEDARNDRAPPDFHFHDMETLLDRKGEQFQTAVRALNGQAEWRSGLDFPTDLLAREARAADLVIIGNAAENQDPFRALDPGSFILKAGRPVLVVPKGVASFSPKHVAIAWKDAREARRAVLDALPFLQQAETVMIVEILDSRKRTDLARYQGCQQLSDSTWHQDHRRAIATCRCYACEFAASADRGRKHQLDGRGRLRTLAVGGMGVWRRDAGSPAGESNLLPVRALRVVEDVVRGSYGAFRGGAKRGDDVRWKQSKLSAHPRTRRVSERPLKQNGRCVVVCGGRLIWR